MARRLESGTPAGDAGAYRLMQAREREPGPGLNPHRGQHPEPALCACALTADSRFPAWRDPAMIAGRSLSPRVSSAGLSRDAATSVDFDGGQRYRPSKAVTAYKEYPERSHHAIGGPGWEQAADYALRWAMENTYGQPGS
jgi:hypothetical protein